MPNRNVAWMLVLVLIALMFWRLPPIIAQRDSIYNTFSPLVVVRNQIQRHYVESVNDQVLLEGAIQGMMSRLDRFSAYIPPSEYADFKKRTDGVFSGIGIELGETGGVLTIISPIENTPAFSAGVLAGDLILAIDGKSTKNMSVDEAVKRISGKPGTSVMLTLLHAGTESPVDVTISRAPITLQSVRGWIRNRKGDWDYLIDPEDKIAYIRISSFIEKTASDFTDVLARLREQGAVAIILDLRSNPGGVLEAAVDVVDCFLSEGLIVWTRERQGDEQRYHARRQVIGADMPLAVLVDGGSASASEIVAGALQDHKRAVVLGQRTYGKGSVQNIIEIESGRSAIKLTAAYYYLPSGRRIHRVGGEGDSDWDVHDQQDGQQEDLWGVKPDVLVAVSPQRIERIREARLQLDHARADVATSAPVDEPASQPDEAAIRAMLMDEQVEAALDVLRKEIHSKSEDRNKNAVRPAA